MKIKIELEFELSIAEIELLRHIDKESYAEYRDLEWNNFEEFECSQTYLTLSQVRTNEELLSYFNNRNTNGTYPQAERLSELELIENEPMSWHRTYVLTNLGKKLAEQL